MWLILLPFAIIGWGVYQKQQIASGNSPTQPSVGNSPNASGQNPTPNQSQATYPYTQAVSPRVDQTNQPWYGTGNRMAAVGPTDNTLKDISAILPSASNIMQNMQDIFGADDANTQFYSSTQPSPSMSDAYAGMDISLPDNGNDIFNDVGADPTTDPNAAVS